MKQRLQILIGSVFGSLIIQTQAYVLDQSCAGDPQAFLLVGHGLQSAFLNVELVIEELAKRPWDKNDGGDYQALSNLGEWLFGDDGTNPPVDTPGHGTLPVPEDIKDDPRRPLDKVRDILSGALTMKRYITPAPTAAKGPFEVEIYCDLDRFEKPTNGALRIWDKINKYFYFVPGLGKGDPYPCENPFLQAFTSGSPGAGRRNIMQICPHYLDKLKVSQYLSSKDFYKRLPLPDWILPTTEIDSYSLFDNTLLHELCHTFPAGGLDDSGVAVGSYGWRNINFLRTYSKNRAIRNADSVAYFALGVRMIKEQRLIPQKDGTVREVS